MKRSMLAVALTGVLSVSALAGEMPTCGVVAATSDTAVATTTEPGEMPTVPGPGLLETIIRTITTWP